MAEITTLPSKMTVLVMAAGRRGMADPVAALQGKSHKCLVEIDGIAMIERLLKALIDSECFRQILISVENEDILRQLESTRIWLENGTIRVVPSAESFAGSLARLSESIDQLLPLVITTADNALHTPELIRDFVSTFAGLNGDVAVAVTRERTVTSTYPDEKFGFFRFRDGGYSFCNLYGIRTRKGLNAAAIFRTGGQFRKRPWRILRIFGLIPLVLYKWRLVSLAGVLSRIGRKLGMQIDCIVLPYAFAPIDVDSPESFVFCERVLAERRKPA